MLSVELPTPMPPPPFCCSVTIGGGVSSIEQQLLCTFFTPCCPFCLDLPQDPDSVQYSDMTNVLKRTMDRNANPMYVNTMTARILNSEMSGAPSAIMLFMSGDGPDGDGASLVDAASLLEFRSEKNAGL